MTYEAEVGSLPRSWNIPENIMLSEKIKNSLAFYSLLHYRFVICVTIYKQEEVFNKDTGTLHSGIFRSVSPGSRELVWGTGVKRNHDAGRGESCMDLR